MFCTAWAHLSRRLEPRKRRDVLKATLPMRAIKENYHGCSTRSRRQHPHPYLAAGAAAVVIGVLATPLRRLVFNVPVLLTIGGALLGRKEGKSETRSAAAKPAPAKRKAPARKRPAAKKAAASA